MQSTLMISLAMAGLAGAEGARAQGCEARAGVQPPAVIELYTSEGCSSCPPADRWLSSLKGRSDVLALAFHVNYWDRLGWSDRFATPVNTERQHRLAQKSGSGYVYTPQVVMNGRDLRDWQRSTPVPLQPSVVALALRRDGNTVTASVGGTAGNRRLAGYWAVLEDGHSSRVKAGENAGETLRHDHVVTFYQPVDEWVASGPAKAWSLALPSVTAGLARRVAFVVTDPASHRPLQALALAC